MRWQVRHRSIQQWGTLMIANPMVISHIAEDGKAAA